MSSSPHSCAAASAPRSRGSTPDDLRGAREVLAPLLAAPSTSDFVYDAVGHGHLDQAWLWPIRETKRKAARTYARQLVNIDERPDYVYGTSQPQQMQWMKERHPALFERMKRAVAAGRLELQGSFWVETDTNMPGGESLIRQSLVGRRFLQEEFGMTDEQLRLCWLPDTFGYSGNLPQILKKSGMDWFQTIKISWNKVNVFPHRTFHWQGIDGSTVLVHMPPEGDYNSRGAADGLLRGLSLYPEKALKTALLVFGSGDGGGGPGEIHLELADRERSLRGLPQVKPGRAVDFFERLEKREAEIETTYLGELYLETHQGTYTTQAAIKAGNRLVERKLHEVEALAAIRGVECRERLEPLWREVLLHHFHDILPGSSIERVNREARETHARIAAELDVFLAELIEGLPQQARRRPRRDQPLPRAARRARAARRHLVPGAARAVLGRGAGSCGAASGTRLRRRDPQQRRAHAPVRAVGRDRLVPRRERRRARGCTFNAVASTGWCCTTTASSSPTTPGTSATAT